MTTRQVHADEALALGLVSRVCERGELLGAARQVSEQMRRVGPIALAQVKRLTSLYASTSNALISQYLEVFGNAMLAGTSDFQEGEHAFLEKRPPRFTGH